MVFTVAKIKKILSYLIGKYRERAEQKYREVVEKHQISDAKKFRFYKFSNAFRGPIEALLTLYLSTFYIIFKQGYLSENPTGTQLVQMILFSFALAAIICFLYTGATVLTINNWTTVIVRKYSNDFVKLHLSSNDIYKKIHLSFLFRMLGIHILGTVCYIGVAWLIADIYIYRFLLPAINPQELKYILLLWGVVSGLLWNINGFLSDMRIDWGKVFSILDWESIKTKEIGRIKLKWYALAKWFQFFIGFVILLLMFHVMNNPRLEAISFPERVTYIVIETCENEYCEIYDVSLCESTPPCAEVYFIATRSISINFLFSYSAFFTILISILVLYIKYTYKIFFSRSLKEESTIFPLPEDFVKRRKCNKTTIESIKKFD